MVILVDEPVSSETIVITESPAINQGEAPVAKVIMVDIG